MLTMIDTSSAAPEIQLEPLTDRTRKGWPGFLQPLALGIVMLISLFMNFYQLGQNGFGNLYYAAGVRSMLDNWHNFFFVSFDPGGFVTIDKPPLGFWLQVLSAKLFGFTAFSVYLPQALAGVLSVLLLYHLVRRHFGVVAGLLAALALAISPISVVTNRNNTIDSTLVLVMLLGAWAVMRAAETGKWRWLMLTAVLVNARSLPGRTCLRSSLLAGCAQKPQDAYRAAPGGSRGHANHLIVMGGRSRSHSVVTAPVCGFQPGQFRDQSGPWLQWHPASPRLIRLWRHKFQKYEWDATLLDRHRNILSQLSTARVKQWSTSSGPWRRQ